MLVLFTGAAPPDQQRREERRPLREALRREERREARRDLRIELRDERRAISIGRRGKSSIQKEQDLLFQGDQNS